MATRQRLVLCLDGTWNRQDSSTNVLHHFNLVHEGPVAGADIVQKKYYHLGVGTGVLDSITGGGFGFGLEANVRDAYNWLVENFCDYGGQTKPDEIFIFGFSRGAYEVRSLVGFIAQCGLLRRGAPTTVEELWDKYCILGRQKENRQSLWERVLGNKKKKLRALTDLQRATDLNPDEQLWVHWSRRINITYLGIYDTVGAIGWDALAIPGLTSRIALHNNVRPTTIIQHCRHALAIDENRSSFNHTPFIAYLEENSDELARAEGATARSIDQNRAMWRRKIEQRWFAGAHSNIGGGYPDNPLAQPPLRWIMEGATSLGLNSESVPQPESVNPTSAPPRDSYHEFAAPLWDTVIRNKRNYRIIDPAPKLRARADGRGHGFALETINEVVDESVIQYWGGSGTSVSPNLECYLRRKGKSLPSGSNSAQHVWLKEKLFPYSALAVWTVVAVVGAYAIDSLGGLTPHGLPFWIAWLIATALPFIDWGESQGTFAYAAGIGGPRVRAFLDAIYWARTFGFVLFVFGFVYGICVAVASGWRWYWPGFDILVGYWPIPLLAAAPALLLTRLRSKFAWAALFIGPAFVVLLGALCFGVAAGAHHIFPEITSPPYQRVRELPSLAGLLLLLQLAAIYFWRSLFWCGEPLGQAHLDSITKLQLCRTPAQVTHCLNGWRDRLANTCVPDPKPDGAPTRNLLDVLRQALWRDILGFIPVYTGFLLFGLWFATQVPQKDWAAVFNWIPVKGPALAEFLASAAGSVSGLWWALPLVTAAADYLEDICHLRYLKSYEKAEEPRKPSAALTLFSFSMTMIKDLTFFTGGVITTLAVVAGTHAANDQLWEWRAKFAVLLTVLGFTFAALVMIAAIVSAIRKSTDHTDKPEIQQAAARAASLSS